ncbi:putative bifunctional diguanylate cyclase/phosphodiesterase [Vibrio aquimaris]|uniref:Phytochrome-like protein cph2 n=1 Tax=Vibrio aquimaris TaxID=2587862 RepID=A0A5P9CP18_9VIBR|nr:bifunctional diguanylate cyclase/phosphodiesterase [Vibrio aquimaris]QFT27936.1 Phytochrome-like protein cph2 [Vibrio aquimaris]
MSHINTANLVIPEDISSSWQNNINLIAEIMSIPTALIVDTQKDKARAVKSNKNAWSSYNISKSRAKNKDLCCWIEDEHIMLAEQDKLTPGSDTFLSHESWSDSCQGLLIKWPNGNVFGTICIWGKDVYSPKFCYQELISSFRNSIELQLSILYQKEKLKNTNIELRNKVVARNHDMDMVNGYLEQEIKKRQRAEEIIDYLRWHDIRTGFLNRHALEKEVTKLAKKAQNNTQFDAVIHINFINGLLIQEQTDSITWKQLLIQFDRKIKNKGNDKIITSLPTSADLVLVVSDLKDQSDLDDLCKHIVQSSQSTFVIDRKSFHLNAYIGVCTTKDTLCPNSLLKFASKVALSSKDSGQNYRYYSQDLAIFSSDTQEMESYLLKAIRDNDLLLHFQPKVCTKTGAWIGAEALLRWRHPTMGDISSETLINIAEKNGLIFEIGRFVLTEAVKKGTKWVEWNSEFKIAINVSVVQLNSLEFVQELEHLLITHQLSAKNIELEITESGIVIDDIVMEKSLKRLRNLGVTLSLDDFGTGYSSYDYLKKFPFNALKIDKSFIEKIDECRKDQEIVRSIIGIARAFNMKVTAEGIENKKHEEFIVSEGCEYGQGYLYSKPIPSNEFEYYLYRQVILQEH